MGNMPKQSFFEEMWYKRLRAGVHSYRETKIRDGTETGNRAMGVCIIQVRILVYRWTTYIRFQFSRNLHSPSRLCVYLREKLISSGFCESGMYIH